MVQQWRVVTMLGVASSMIAVGLQVAGCGGGSGGGVTVTPSPVVGAMNSRSYQGTQSPGDPWSWTITTSTSTFTASNSVTGYAYSGTWSVLSSGFERLDVTSTTDPNVAVPIPLYGLEVPQTVFIAKPVGRNTRPVIAASLGTPPAGPTADYNYIHIPEHDYDENRGDAFGTLDFTITGNTFAGTLSRFNILGNPLTPQQVPYTLVDDNGMLSGGAVTGGITASGVAILDLGPNAGGAVAVQTPSADVDLSAVVSASYRGFHVNPDDGSFLVWGSTGLATPGSGTSLVIGTYANVEKNTQNPNYATITFTSQPSPGELLATVSYTASRKAAPAVFAVNQVNGKYILFGIVKHPDGTAHFTLVQQ